MPSEYVTVETDMAAFLMSKEHELRDIRVTDDQCSFVFAPDERCGELDIGMDEERVWMFCTCGAVISRALEPSAITASPESPRVAQR